MMSVGQVIDATHVETLLAHMSVAATMDTMLQRKQRLVLVNYLKFITQ